MAPRTLSTSALFLLAACGGNSLLGSSAAGGAGGSRDQIDAAGTERGGAPSSMGGNAGAGGASGSSADAALDSGKTGDAAEAGPKIDPRFRIIEPLAPPTEVFSGPSVNRMRTTIVPTDRVVALTHRVLWASDDLSIVVGTSSHNVAHPPGDFLAQVDRTYLWTEAKGTVGIDAVPTSISNHPVGMSADAKVIYGFSSDANENGGIFRWTEAGVTTLTGPPGWSAGDTLFTVRSPTFWGPANVAQDGNALVGADSMGGVRWTGATGGLRFTNTKVELLAMSQTGDAILYADDGHNSWHWWSPATGSLAIEPLPGLAVCGAERMTSDGSAVYGHCLNPSPPYASRLFRWTRANGTVSLATAPANSNFSEVSSITPDGSILAGIMSTNDTFGPRHQIFRYTQAAGVEIIYDHKVPNQRPIEVYGMSQDGRMIFGLDQPDDGSAVRPFVWREGTGLVSGLINAPTITSRDGTVLAGIKVTDSQSEIGSRPFIFDAKGERDIATELSAAGVDLGGFHLATVVLVETGPDIKIVGTGLHPGTSYPPTGLPGESRAWVARLPL